MNSSAQTVKETLSDPKLLAIIREELLVDGVSSRTNFAANLCERFGFRDDRGGLRVGTCLKALRDLEQQGELELPERIIDINRDWKPRRLPDAVPEPHAVPESVDKVQGLEIDLVDPADDIGMRTWNELIIRDHPWGNLRLVGQQLRYLIRSKQGFLGAVGFAASALSLADREHWISWDEDQQRVHRNRILNLSRLLIRPSVQCKNLSSWILGACVRRVADDFERRYGYEPWILESFVDEQRHDGRCFQAANWCRIGQTKGRGRNDREGLCAESIKGIYTYPLVADFRERMGVDPSRGSYLRPLAVEQGLASAEWVEQEFGTVELGDKRLRNRLMKIIGDRAKQPDTSYLESCKGNRGAIKGFYAFVDNPREAVNPEAILSTHRERTIGRMMSQRLVLVAQDTTDLNYASRSQTEDLGPIGTNQTGAKSFGLKLHTSLALSEEGLPLGVLRSVAYAPEMKEKGDKPALSNRLIEEKKSFKWI